MSTKKNFTIEELEEAYKESMEKAGELKERLEQMKRDAEEKKKAELALQQEQRLQEIKEVSKHLNELYKSYIEDYGYLRIDSRADDYDWFPSFWKYNFWF